MINLTRLTHRNIFSLTFLLVGFAAVLLTIGGFSFAASQEQHDSFCASCHTHPESTFYERTLSAETVDLATAHQGKEVRCIDCHSGSGLVGRLTAELMGAQNAAMWYTGRAVQPASLTHPIDDDHCLKCHAEVPAQKYDMDVRSQYFGPKGHYHSFLTQWKSTGKGFSGCTSCHSGHQLGASTDSTWIVSASVQNVCKSCHDVLASN